MLGHLRGESSEQGHTPPDRSGVEDQAEGLEAHGVHQEFTLWYKTQSSELAFAVETGSTPIASRRLEPYRVCLHQRGGDLRPIPRPVELRSEEACSQPHSLPVVPLLPDGLCASHVSRFPTVPRIDGAGSRAADVRRQEHGCVLPTTLLTQRMWSSSKNESDETSRRRCHGVEGNSHRSCRINARLEYRNRAAPVSFRGIIPSFVLLTPTVHRSSYGRTRHCWKTTLTLSSMWVVTLMIDRLRQPERGCQTSR